MIFLQELIFNTFVNIHLQVNSFNWYRTTTCGFISVQSSTCYIHHPSLPTVHNAVKIMKLHITMLSSVKFPLVHPHIW